MVQNQVNLFRILLYLKKYRWVKKRIFRAKISWDFPIYLHLEPTNLCNLRCSFCPNSLNKEIKKQYLELKLYRKIIDECAKYKKLLLLLLHKDGEPLLHPNLPEMIRYAKDKRSAKVVHLATNGILLNEDKSREIINSGLDDILISVDAVRKSTFLKLKGVDKLEEVESNVKNFIRIRNKLKSRKPYVRVKMIDMQETHSEISLFRRKWKGIVDKVEITRFCNWPQFEIAGNNADNSKGRYPCTILWYSPAINCDGKVSICCLDGDRKRIVGDVSEESLFDIWHGEKLQAIRDAHCNGNYNICGNCSAWSLEPNLGSWLKSQEKSKNFAYKRMVQESLEP